MVFQSYALFPHLSVAENIIFGLRVRGVSALNGMRGSTRCRHLGLGATARAQAVAIVGRPAAAGGTRPRDHRRGARCA